jgi:hypothetical protein
MGYEFGEDAFCFEGNFDISVFKKFCYVFGLAVL